MVCELSRLDVFEETSYGRSDYMCLASLCGMNINFRGEWRGLSEVGERSDLSDLRGEETRKN